MNNPDERTAVDQFGKGDKYFGICVLMATMPGLPMFGHGQIEGLSEKYGMEFKRAYWNEQPDPDLVERHKREIFPLLHRRALFAGMEHFLLYDFFTPEGGVNEDIFAFSNGLGSDRGLVVFHNKFADTQGWVRSSAAFSVKGPDGQRSIIQRTLGEGLNLYADPQAYCLYRDYVSGLEYIRPSLDIMEKGLFLELHAYESRVFLDFREVMDDEWGSYRRVNEYLAGRGVPNVQDALQELLLQPVLYPLRQIINPGYLRFLIGSRMTDSDGVLLPGLFEEARAKLDVLMDGIELFTGSANERERLHQELRAGLRLALSLPTLEERYPLPGSKKYQQAVKYLQQGSSVQEESTWALLFSWLYLHNLGKLSENVNFETVTSDWMQEWLFNRVFTDTIQSMGASEERVIEQAHILKILVTQQCWFDKLVRPAAEQVSAPPFLKNLMETWLADSDIQQYLKINRFEDVLWFNKDRFKSFVWWMVFLAVMSSVSRQRTSASLLVERLLLAHGMAQKLLQAADKSGFKIADLLKNLD